MTAIPQATAIDGYRWLKNDIIRGVYHPDEKLRMSLLTSRYALGVGPLREALSQLVAERLVTVVNQKGYRVAPMSEQELLDIFDARANMEAMLVRLAIERGGDEWEAELLARAHLLNKLESCEASEHLLDEWDQRHQAFHTAIVAGCGSQYLLQMRERLFDLAARYRFIWLRTTVLSVEIRDIVIPQELQEVMSTEAQAEREKNARMVLAEVEKDISSMLVDAAHVYEENEVALRLRTMHLLYESVKGSGGTVVIPSAYSEGFADAGLDRALDSLKTGK